MLVFTVSKPIFTQIKYYLNENINKEFLFVYCNMNSSSFIKIEGDSEVIFKSKTESGLISFNLSEDEKVFCINIGE